MALWLVVQHLGSSAGCPGLVWGHRRRSLVDQLRWVPLCWPGGVGAWHQLVAACPGDGTHGSCSPCRTRSQADRDGQRGEKSQADVAQLAEAARVL